MTRNILFSTAILLGLQTFAAGQSVQLSIGSGSGTPGGTVTVPITVASSGGAQTTGLQWTFSYSSDITGVTVVAGASTTDAGKSLSCSGNNCLVAGFNSTVIANGTVASATFQIAANPSSNPILIQLTSVVATTASATSIPSSGGSGSISLPVTVALSSLNCTSSTINTPGSTSCSVTLTGTATGSGFAVSLSSNNVNLTVPSSITVASGQTSNTFTATGAQVSTNQTGVVTASSGGVNKTSTLSLVAPAQLTSVACAPSTLGSSASSTCTVTLNKAATSAATVSLSSNNGLLTVPANVTVASGQSSATFTATAGTVGSSQSAIVTATLSSQSQPATISLVAAQLSSLSCSPASVNAPGTSTCTATLTAAASSATSVMLASNNVNITVPGSVSIGSGLSSATFTATVAAMTSNQSALLTASLNGGSKTFTLSAVAPAQLTSVACAPSTLGSNASSTCTVALNKAALSAAAVSLASNNGLLTVPASVTVALGQSSATFTATSGVVSSSQSAIVTATLSGQSQQATISLAAASVLSSISCSPSAVNAPGTSTCTASLTAAASSSTSVTLASNNANVTVPGSVNIGAGLSSATFTATVAAVTSDQTALLTGTLSGLSQSFTLSASAPVQLTSVGCAPSTLGSNTSSTCTVTLNKAATSAATVALASNSGLLTVPANVTVASGQSSATFAATSGNVTSSQNAIVTATLSGQSQQATLSLAAAVQLSSLTCSPATVNAPGTATCTVTLTAAASSAANVTLQSTNTNITVPAGVAVGVGLSSASFTATVAAVTSNQSALLTATLNSISQSFTLSAAAPAPVQLTSLACGPSTLGSSASSTCTVTLNQAASSATAVSVASNNGLLTVPANVTVASGQSSGSFTATSGTISSSQNAIVTATLSGQSQQATISLASAAQLSGLTCTPTTVSGPGTSSCTATLTAVTSSAASVTLASNNTNVTVPGSVNIAAGFSSGTFTATVAAVTTSQSAILTATLNGGSQTFTLTAQGATKGQPKSVHCSPSAMSSNKSGKCAVTLNAPAATDSVVVIASSTPLLSVPPSVTVPAGQSSANFDATSGNVNTSMNAIITAGLNGESQQTTITLGVPVNCQEFQTSPGGLCMIQNVLPWITYGGGWGSRLNAGNLSNGTGGGSIQFSFTLLPAVPTTGGAQNHMTAFFKDSVSGQTQVGESATYALSPGGSVAVDFLSPAAGCDSHGQNCGNAPDPNANAYGSLLVQYVADDPASLRGIAKAQLTLLANVASADSGWQTTEREVPAANLWTAPVSVSANPTANPQASQQASAALANPGPAAITVRGTLYDGNGGIVTLRDFQIPSLGSIALVFSQDPSQPFGGFGSVMFPRGQDFNGLVTFQVISPSGGSVQAMILQYVGNAVSSVEVNSQNLSASGASSTRCAEFTLAADGTCTVQYALPWVLFGGGWESRLKTGNWPGAMSGVQVRFTLRPPVPSFNGSQNHLPAYFTDNRSGQMQVGDSANYTLGPGQSVDVHFLYPPAGCDSRGQNCSNQPDPSALSYGSVLVQYSAADPGSLRTLVYPQLAFLARPGGESYSSQVTERAATGAMTWTAPVAMSADPNANPQTYRQASAAITNQGATPVTVRGTLRDQNGNVVAYNDFQISSNGAIGMVLSWDPSQPLGGFGNAAFPQGQDFNGWVTFDVTSQGSSGISVLVLQYVGSTISGVNAQALP